MEIKKEVFPEMQKKKILISFLILCTITFCTTGCQKVMIQRNSSEPDVIAAKIPAKEISVTDNASIASPPSSAVIQCQKDGNVSDAIVEIVNQQLSLLPSNLQNAFIADGWSIYVTDIDLDKTYYGGKYGQVMASTNYEEQRILIESRTDAAYESPIHETGHWFDYYVGFPSCTEEFASVYAAEKDVFIRSYGSTCVSDTLEFFAEGFWQYIVNPDKLKTVSPELYLFIHDQYCQLCVWLSSGRITNLESLQEQLHDNRINITFQKNSYDNK